MRIVHVVDNLGEHWYSTHLVEAQARAHPEDEFIVYGFDDVGYDLRPNNAEASFDFSWWSYVVKMPYRIWKVKPDIVHIQSEPETFENVVGGLFAPIFLLLLKLMGVTIVTTIHGPIFGDDIWRRSAILAPNRLVGLLIYPYSIPFYNAIVALSDETIVHGDVFKRRLGERYFVPSGELTVVHHGVPSDDYL